MCRIWGISYGPDGPEAEDWTPNELAQIMFPALIRQGPHAWGWMSWNGESLHAEKHPGRCDTPDAMALMNVDPNAKWVIGHTRYATHGSPEDNRNNHPLRHGKFMGVHNGVLRNHDDILKVTGREDPKTEVDSEAIFAAIDKWGHRKGLERINGDMVTCYVNMEKPRTVHVAKSYGRPLVLARTRAGSIIWASEQQAIDATGMDVRPMGELSSNKLLRIRTGKVVERIQYRTTPLQRRDNMVQARGFSASSTRRAMLTASARKEIEDAEQFIARERSKGRVRAATKSKAKNSLQDPTELVRMRKGDPDWGLQSDDGQSFFVGNGRWVSEREFVAILMDEMGWV